LGTREVYGILFNNCNPITVHIDYHIDYKQDPMLTGSA